MIYWIPQHLGNDKEVERKRKMHEEEGRGGEKGKNMR